MVGITAVYVIATIAICWANFITAKAAKQQMQEMKKQYEEANRPRIEVEMLHINRRTYALRFVNRGITTACNVHIIIDQEFIDSMPAGVYKDMLRKEQGRQCIIGVGQCYDLFVGYQELRTCDTLKPLKGKVLYYANEKAYSGDFYIDFKQYNTFYTTTTDEEKTMNAIQKMEKHLVDIEKAIRISKERAEEDA